jgi:hypothetical protein
VRGLVILPLLVLTVYLVGCGEESPRELLPDESLKPLLSSAPLLSKENHPHGWEKGDCLECHKPSTITGHGKLERKCADCHGRNGVGGAVDTCETCHGYPPDTGNHTSHVKERKPSCDGCHADNLHANGVLNINFPKGGEFKDGTCSVACHKSLKWGESGCTLCHGNPPETGNHISHVKEQKLSCQECHTDNIHVNGVLEVKFSKGGRFSDKSCTVACHKSLKWGESGCTLCHGNPPETGNHISHVKEQKLSCQECHTDNIHMNGVSDVNFLKGGQFSDGTCTVVCHKSVKWGESGCTLCHGNPPDTGKHRLHVEERGLDCDSCHMNRKHDDDVKSGEIDVGGVEYEPLDGNCTSTCHERKRWDCKSCHGYPPNTGKHKKHKVFGCNICHKDHLHSYKAAVSPTDLSNVEVKLEIMGSYEKPTKTCKTVGCHEDKKWGE